MASAARIAGLVRRMPVLILAVVVLAVGVAGAFHAPAMAQEQQNRGWSLRDLLFPRRSEQIEPPLNIEKAKPKPRKPRVPRAPAEPQTPIAEKVPDARTVLVVGDFMASGLAEGLDTAFAENTGIRIVVRSNGSSGFVRDDFYNWPEQIKTLIETEKPAAVVVMLGSNDRQQMKVGDVREQPRSENWTKEYERRTDALGKAIADAKVPFLWVGMPAFRVPKMTSDMLAFNESHHQAAESHMALPMSGRFRDENGASYHRPRHERPAGLRADDGINLRLAAQEVCLLHRSRWPRSWAFAAPGSLAPATARGRLPSGTAPAAAPNVMTAPPMLLSDPALDGAPNCSAPRRRQRQSGLPAKTGGEGAGGFARPRRRFAWPPRRNTGDARRPAAITLNHPNVYGMPPWTRLLGRQGPAPLPRDRVSVRKEQRLRCALHRFLPDHHYFRHRQHRPSSRTGMIHPFWTKVGVEHRGEPSGYGAPFGLFTVHATSVAPYRIERVTHACDRCKALAEAPVAQVRSIVGHSQPNRSTPGFAPDDAAAGRGYPSAITTSSRCILVGASRSQRGRHQFHCTAGQSAANFASSAK